MKKTWWKIVCVVFLTYTLIMGLIVPLSPGLITVSPDEGKTGDTVSIKLKGYNSHFKDESNSLKIWIKNDSLKYLDCSITYNVVSNTEMQASFVLPYLVYPDKKPVFVDVMVNDNKDGNIIYDEAIKINTSNPDAPTFTGDKSRKCADSYAVAKAPGLHFPNRNILYESIRNLFFHVPMWFAMIMIISISLIYSIKYLRGFNLKDDTIAVEAAKTGILFGVLGLITGSIWARFTWGGWWVNDVKVNGAAVTLLIYFAYLILRNSVDGEQKRARISAVYSIIAFTMLVVFLIIFPRMNSSLHPGNGGNPGFNKYDLDSTMRMVFYPAVIGWCLLSYWILTILVRFNKLNKYFNSANW
jgi:heme exporter protein C